MGVSGFRVRGLGLRVLGFRVKGWVISQNQGTLLGIRVDLKIRRSLLEGPLNKVPVILGKPSVLEVWRRRAVVSKYLNAPCEAPIFMAGWGWKGLDPC